MCFISFSLYFLHCHELLPNKLRTDPRFHGRGGGRGDGREASGSKTNFWVMVPPETPESIKYILGNEVFKVYNIVLLISSYFCCCNFDAGGMIMSPRLSPLTRKMQIVNKSNIFTVNKSICMGCANERYTYIYKCLWYFRMRQVENKMVIFGTIKGSFG